MNTLSRRDAVKALAAGAAVTAAASASALTPPSRTPPMTRSDGSLPTKPSSGANAAASAIHRASAPVCGPGAISTLAVVGSCVSWDDRVLLTLADGRTGLVSLSASARSLAAAAHAAGTHLAVRVWGHDPRANEGVGGFEGALVALDLADLPGDRAPSV
jgi:hypothetical protein